MKSEAFFVLVKRAGRNNGDPYWTFEKIENIDETGRVRAQWVRAIEKEIRDTKGQPHSVIGYQIHSLKWSGDDGS